MTIEQIEAWGKVINAQVDAMCVTFLFAVAAVLFVLWMKWEEK